MADDVALVLRRAGFGPTGSELGAAMRAGYAATLSSLFQPSQPDIGAQRTPIPHLGSDPRAVPNLTRQQREAADAVRRDQVELITRWWLDRMTVAEHQAVEKLVFFWHGHWATSAFKVRSAQLMLAQHRVLREKGTFAAMVRRMVVDPALIFWLDGQLNTKKSPNENLARELFELFTLGIGRYGEVDIKESARALTGWRIDFARAMAVFEPKQHDAGAKTILGRTRNFDAASLVDLLLENEDCPPFIASRMWFRYASSTQPIPGRVRDRMIDKFPVPAAMLQAMFDDDAFRATAGTMAKQPVEWLVGALRQLGLRPSGLPAEVVDKLLKGLEFMGQLPFAPPSVGGWPTGTAWLTSAAAQTRLDLANSLARRVNADRMTPEELAYVLCIDRWTDRTYNLLRGTRDARLMLTYGLASPEYLVT